MNHGTRNGNTPGFRLKGTLNKLNDAKSVDNKSTLMQAIARQLHTRGKDVKVLSEELPHVMSSNLKISWQDAAEMLTQVRGD